MPDDKLYRKDLAPCALCKKGLMHNGIPLFNRVTIESWGLEAGAIQRQQALDTYLGSPVLGHIMGTNEPLAKLLHRVQVMVCQTCSMEPHLMPRLEEIGLAMQEEKEEADRQRQAAEAAEQEELRRMPAPVAVPVEGRPQ